MNSFLKHSSFLLVTLLHYALTVSAGEMINFERHVKSCDDDIRRTQAIWDKELWSTDCTTHVLSKHYDTQIQIHIAHLKADTYTAHKNNVIFILRQYFPECVHIINFITQLDRSISMGNLHLTPVLLWQIKNISKYTRRLIEINVYSHNLCFIPGCSEMVYALKAGVEYIAQPLKKQLQLLLESQSKTVSCHMYLIEHSDDQQPKQI